ncbi:2-hydroxyacid dehydrogenase [Methanocella sp. MCL-LM]|uniref:2-hydroxyacid dehydrogenase n=1 Tax=Methanocella sp. MCL-LM TaxID=3412035 RepID=UPI003C74425F
MVFIVVADAVSKPELYESRFSKLGEVKVYRGQPSSIEEYLCRVDGADIAVVSHFKLPARAFDTSNLKLVALTRTGFDDVDLDAATLKGVTVTNVPGYSNEAVAEHVFAMLLSFVRRIPEADFWMREEKFDCTAFEGRELRGKTLGVIGTGQIGSRVAEIARCFGMDVIAYDVRRSPASGSKFRYVGLDRLCAESDFITLHLPLTPDTEGLLDDEAFRLMKPGAVIVNTARGPVIRQDALVRALDEGRIGGACLDVYDREPLPQDSPLIGLSNTLLTPHIAYNTREAKEQSIAIAAENVAQFLAGKPRNVVNPAVLGVKQ